MCRCQVKMKTEVGMLCLPGVECHSLLQKEPELDLEQVLSHYQRRAVGPAFLSGKLLRS